MLRVVFRTDSTGVIDRLGRAVDDIKSIELDNAFYVEDGTWIESLTITAETAFSPPDLIASQPGIELFHHTTLPENPTKTSVVRVILTARESYPFVLEVVLRQGAIPNRIVYRPGVFEVVATVQDWEQFRAIADEVSRKFGTFDLASLNEIENLGEPLDSGRLSETLVTKLSDKQLTILETAYNMGYFEVPRQVTAAAVAHEMGISQSNFSERLRTAEHELLGLVFGASVRDPPAD